MAVAKASGANFIRAEGFVFSHVADEGWMDACAGELLRYRGAIDAKDVLVFTDIKKKHRYVCAIIHNVINIVWFLTIHFLIWESSLHSTMYT